jgi:hypothetical protein
MRFVRAFGVSVRAAAAPSTEGGRWCLPGGGKGRAAAAEAERAAMAGALSVRQGVQAELLATVEALEVLHASCFMLHPLPCPCFMLCLAPACLYLHLPGRDTPWFGAAAGW